jgi:hypothetical protein
MNFKRPTLFRSYFLPGATLRHFAARHALQTVFLIAVFE